MKGYKGFHRGLVCRGKKYKENTIFKEDRAVICRRGMHFCKSPVDVLHYYPLLDNNNEPNEFAEVEALGEVYTDDNAKYCTRKLKIGTKLGLRGFVQKAVDYLLSNADGKDPAATTSTQYSQLAISKWYGQLVRNGNYNRLAASGNCSILAMRGEGNNLATSGNHSILVADNDYNRLATSGASSQLVANGHNSVLATSGDNSQLVTIGAFSRLAASSSYNQLATDGHYGQLVSCGGGSQLTANGACSRLAASGSYNKLVANGENSQLSSSGESNRLISNNKNNILVSSGYHNYLEANGADSVIAGIGIDNIAKGKKGCWIVLAEWIYNSKDNTFILKCIKSTRIDGINIKEDTYYQLRDGEFVEAFNK